MLMRRRDWIKQLSLATGGAALSPMLLPLLQQARAEAAGKPPPRRFVFVIKSSGLTPAELVPGQLDGPEVKPAEKEKWPDDLEDAESLINVSLTDYKLPPTLASLEPFRKQVTILQGLSGKMCRGGHSSWYGALGCYRTGGEHNPGRVQAPTIDGLLARGLPAIFPHVGLSIGGRVMDSGAPIKDSVVYPGISAIAKDRPLPYQASPTLAFNDLFGLVDARQDAKTRQQLRSTLLDFMVDDIKRLDQRLGSAEKVKLDHYREAFESLRERRRRLQGIEAEVRRHAPEVTDKYTSLVETDRIEAHFDIGTAALIAGLTRVLAIRPDTLSMRYSGLGITKGVHGLGHGEGDDINPVEARARIREFHIQQIARMAARLKSVPEGDGTMLDNTLIVYLSDAAEKHHSSCRQWPFVLVGGAGLSWRKGAGRYVQYPGYGKPGHRTIAGLYCTLLHAINQPRDRFGHLDLRLDEDMQTGPLAELV